MFELERFAPQMRELDGFGELSTGKLMASIEAHRRVELARLLVGLGIPHVGRALARSLAGFIAERFYHTH